ncbi:hypothetical protein Rhe02_09820 [Rhizocola hellebori]|uniref:HNH nuclease domain-containing protein n=1 Tax=Rhizocola hellebori TaxID=1392758 RepID=A0A8J3Q459_9ACTN|nr:HNH endonuclease signature motif containing protein [Rhizocola hellebori]GIH02915.1 hypothetical protein Rhe02_09820 [Rhizocola hellebori]
MTKDRRAKQDARERKALTGESYTTARRHTSRTAEPQFKPDHCASCLQQLPNQVERLFCSELCRQTAEVIRYWRAIVRDGRIENSDVSYALQTRVAHLLAGGYPKQKRHLSDEIRQQVWARDEGRCRGCGNPGEEIDHIHGDSADLANLQLLCAPCHHRKTEQRMVPAGAEQKSYIAALQRSRVAPQSPLLLCDDHERWSTIERTLRKERREGLLAQLAEYGFKRADFASYSWSDMWDEVLDENYDEDDFEAHGIDDDSGFGPDSYFARAMAKDD